MYIYKYSSYCYLKSRRIYFKLLMDSNGFRRKRKISTVHIVIFRYYIFFFFDITITGDYILPPPYPLGTTFSQHLKLIKTFIKMLYGYVVCVYLEMGASILKMVISLPVKKKETLYISPYQKKKIKFLKLFKTKTENI